MDQNQIWDTPKKLGELNSQFEELLSGTYYYYSSLFRKFPKFKQMVIKRKNNLHHTEQILQIANVSQARRKIKNMKLKDVRCFSINFQMVSKKYANK